MDIDQAEFTCRRDGPMSVTYTIRIRTRPWWRFALELLRFFWRQACAGFDLRSCFGNTWRLYRAARKGTRR